MISFDLSVTQYTAVYADTVNRSVHGHRVAAGAGCLSNCKSVRARYQIKEPAGYAVRPMVHKNTVQIKPKIIIRLCDCKCMPVRVVYGNPFVRISVKIEPFIREQRIVAQSICINTDCI